MNEGKWSYLPKHFWYDGMDKIKAGKGYRDGKPLGIDVGPCKECDGTMIKLTMNTSNKGFETASEKVCDTCGLVEEPIFDVLAKRDHRVDNLPRFKEHKVEEDLALRKYYNSKGEEIYNQRMMSKFMNERGKIETHWKEVPLPDGKPTIEKTYYEKDYEYYYASHEAWKEDNMPSELPTPDMVETDDTGNPTQHEPLEDILQWTDRNIQIGYKIYLNNPKEAVLYNRPDEERKEYERLQHIRYAEAVASDLQMNELQIEQVKYILKEYPTIMKIPYSYEDIIGHLCLYVISKFYKNYKSFNAYIARYSIAHDYNKTLYRVIKDMLDKKPIWWE